MVVPLKLVMATLDLWFSGVTLTMPEKKLQKYPQKIANLSCNL